MIKSNQPEPQWDERIIAIHNPERLRAFAEEATFMSGHCIDFRCVRAYRFMAWACKNLADSIEGKPTQNPLCRICEKPIGLCKDGTFRTHTNSRLAEVCKGSGMSMSDQSAHAAKLTATK